MDKITTIGIDIEKSTFAVHGLDTKLREKDAIFAIKSVLLRAAGATNAAYDRTGRTRLSA